MRKFYIFFVAALSLVLYLACSKDNTESLPDEIPSIESPELSMLERISLLDNYEIPKTKVLDIVRNFESFVLEESSLKSMSNTEYKIGEKFYFSEVKNELRTMPDKNNNEEFAVYKVGMTKEGNNGYALVSADARHARVIAFVPHVNVDSDDKTDDLGLNIGAREIEKASLMAALQKVKAFNAIKDSLKQSAERKLQLTPSLRSVETENKDLQWLDDSPEFVVERTEKKFPLIKTQWDQGVPYNCKLPQNCPSRPEGRYFAGCGVVAIAQAIAHCEPKLNIYAYNMDWPNIKKASRLFRNLTSNTILNQVGMLMKWVGETTGSKYDCEKTSTSVNAIESILPKVGMRCDGGRAWDWNVIAASLRNGKIVHVSAACDDGAHGWLIDAYIHVNVKGIETIYVHHNFGWSGFWDGYYEVENPLEFTAGGKTYNNKFRIQANVSKI